jgi:hypothetical protein
MIGISHFDNSLNNPFNPDPSKEVVWGEQTWEEMSAAFLGVLIPVDTKAEKVFTPSGASLLKRVPGVAGPALAVVDFSTKAGTR